MYWNAEIETLKPAALQELQLSRLRQTVERAAQSPFYGQRLQEAGVSGANLKSIEDVRRIPFTTKDDLRAHGLRDADPAAYRYGAAPRLFRDHGASHGHLLYPGRYRDLGRFGGPLHVHDRDAGDRRVPEYDGLRPVHRRLGLSLRRRTAGSPDHSHRGRQQPAPVAADAAIRHHRGPHHPQLCPVSAQQLCGTAAWTPGTCRCGWHFWGPSPTLKICGSASRQPTGSRPTIPMGSPR